MPPNSRGVCGAAALWLMNGAAISLSGSLGTIPTSWQIVGQRDFNADGKRDLLWRDSTTNTVAIWLMNGATVSQTGSLGTVPSNWSIVGTGDFNGDGRGDILWRDSATGTVAIWLLNGLSILQAGSLGAVPTTWVIAGTGDFNGDGNTDILWRDTSTGTVAIWLLDLAAHSMTDFVKRGSLGVREFQPPLQLGLQDAVLSDQIFVPRQQLLVHHARDVGQDARPIHISHPFPISRLGHHEAPQKRIG
jgi:hypothetical protein